MKVKLLKKLRKLFQLHQRNGKYKAFENRECLGGIYNQTDWIDKNTAVEKRRDWILKEAQRYLKPKKHYN